MKFQVIEPLLFWKCTPKQTIRKITLLAFFAILVYTVTPLFYPLFGYSSFLKNNAPKQPSSAFDYLNESASLPSTTVKNNAPNKQPSSGFDDLNESASLPSKSDTKCDIFTGEWVPNPEAPYYTNISCREIHEHQNCMKYGRPDSEFMKWRWKPNGCELPIFNPFQFLEIVRGKSMAFVGDSVGRNHMQSLLCLLSRVEWPIDVSDTKDFNFMRRRYPSYNFTLATFWSPHLVRSKDAADSYGQSIAGLMNLYLDEVDAKWITQMEEFDYVIINGGHWFTRPLVFYEKQKIVGCQYCRLENVTTDLKKHYGYRMAFRTAFKAINSLENFKAMTFLRTFALSHFENGEWNKGGDCVRTKPFRSNETQLEGMDLKFYKIQLEELKIAEKEGKKKGLKFRLLDTTQATLLRPDGHPSKYGHWQQKNPTWFKDCVHWCLPGPIDTWNDFLLEMLKMEGVRSAEEKLHLDKD